MRTKLNHHNHSSITANAVWVVFLCCLDQATRTSTSSLLLYSKHFFVKHSHTPSSQVWQDLALDLLLSTFVSCVILARWLLSIIKISPKQNSELITSVNDENCISDEPWIIFIYNTYLWLYSFLQKFEIFKSKFNVLLSRIQ